MSCHEEVAGALQDEPPWELIVLLLRSPKVRKGGYGCPQWSGACPESTSGAQARLR
jgi:hypothetical protein